MLFTDLSLLRGKSVAARLPKAIYRLALPGNPKPLRPAKKGKES
jgi:hypothetical protein